MLDLHQILKYNKNHDPKTGKFTSGGGSSDGKTVSVFVGSVAALHASLKKKGITNNDGWSRGDAENMAGRPEGLLVTTDESLAREVAMKAAESVYASAASGGLAQANSFSRKERNRLEDENRLDMVIRGRENSVHRKLRSAARKQYAPVVVELRVPVEEFKKAQRAGRDSMFALDKIPGEWIANVKTNREWKARGTSTFKESSYVRLYVPKVALLTE